MTIFLPKERASIDELFTIVGHFVAEESIDEDIAFQTTVAAEELFTNLVKYSTQSREPVRMTLQKSDGWLELELVDFDASEFDITTVALPNLDVPIEQRRHGGMGLHLVRRFADDLRYRHEGGNSIITFRKRISQPTK